MKDVSNSTLAMLVVAAIVVSVAGTLMSISKLNEVGNPMSITGRLVNEVNQTGKANLTIPSTAFINLSDSTIELGNLNPGETNSSIEVDDYWVLQNDGNINISIKVYDDGQDPDSNNAVDNGTGPFTSTTNESGCLNDDPHTCWRVKCNNTQSGTCDGTWRSMEINSNARWFIHNLTSADTTDEAKFALNATVPINEPSGTKTSNAIRFFAQATSSV